MLTLPEASGLSVYVWPVYHENAFVLVFLFSSKCVVILTISISCDCCHLKCIITKKNKNFFFLILWVLVKNQQPRACHLYSYALPHLFFEPQGNEIMYSNHFTILYYTVK